MTASGTAKNLLPSNVASVRNIAKSKGTIHLFRGRPCNGSGLIYPNNFIRQHLSGRRFHSRPFEEIGINSTTQTDRVIEGEIAESVEIHQVVSDQLVRFGQHSYHVAHVKVANI